MNDRVFFDTNVLVYAFDQSEPEKRAVAKELMHRHGAGGKLVLSTQVLQEFYVTVTRVGKAFLNPHEAHDVVTDLAEFSLVQVDQPIISQAMKRHQKGNFSFWDSLIVEAALQAGCSRLLSEDMHHGLAVGSLTVHNPFG